MTAPIRAKTFEGETIEVDGKEFIDCTFIDCDLVYLGGTLVFEGNVLSGSSGFKFEGAAGMAVKLLAMMWRDGGKEAIIRDLDRLGGLA